VGGKILTAGAASDDTRERGRGVDVLRHGSDGSWRYVLSLLDVPSDHEECCSQYTGEPIPWDRPSK
jgi:hypothetical protein